MRKSKRGLYDIMQSYSSEREAMDEEDLIYITSIADRVCKMLEEEYGIDVADPRVAHIVVATTEVLLSSASSILTDNEHTDDEFGEDMYRALFSMLTTSIVALSEGAVNRHFPSLVGK